MDLFGNEREQLRKRIQELEAKIEQLEHENQHLQEERDQAEKDRKKAITKRQEAEKKINKLEDTIDGLKGKAQHHEMTSIPHRSITVDAATMDRLAESITDFNTPGNSAVTKYDTKDGKGHIRLADPYVIGINVTTPLPFHPTTYTDTSYNMDILHEQLNDRYLYIHLTDGGSGIAIINDLSIENSTTIKADIKSSHRKGGYSQKRFERLRQQQINEHIEKVEEALEQFSEYGYTQCIISGNKQITNSFAKDVSINYTQLTTNTGAIDDEDDLESGFRSAMACKITQLPADEHHELLQD